MKKVPRVACINDISGFGRCSLTSAIAILSVCSVQPCPLPTAVLSRHTGFPEYFFKAFTDSMPAYLDNWSDLDFDGIYSGFLGSERQISIVLDYIKARLEKQKKPPIVLVDTVMGDGGRPYSTYTRAMCEKMKTLAQYADIITPNITEACILTSTEYTGEQLTDEQTHTLLLKLAELGSRSVVITGVHRGDNILNVTYDNGSFFESSVHCISRTFSGTGDLFASVVCAAVLNGFPLEEASDIAGRFVHMAARYTVDAHTPVSEGVIFEPLLCSLAQMLSNG